MDWVVLFREGNVWKGVHPVRLDGACDLRDWEGKQCFQEPLPHLLLAAVLRPWNMV